MPKRLLLQLLARLRLLTPAYRAYERARTLAHRNEDGASDGVPLPPARLRLRVAGTAGAEWFLESGRLAAESIHAALRTAGAPLEERMAILDFGCGCGRVLRHLRDLRGELHGSDADAAAIRWCRANLPFARFHDHRLAPPLELADESFDLVYALSVFTHLPPALERAWVDELTRILQPRGFLLLTTHGDRYRERLTESERARYDRGDVVVRFEEAAGLNLCTTFHPPSYVRERLAHGLELVGEVPVGAAGNPYQDLYLLQKP